MNDTLIQNVSDTAFMAAAYRAAETARSDALFHDPLSARLAGERGEKILAGLPKKAFMMSVMGLFLSRERRAAMKQYAGYVLFEPE
jgi:O-methyltransferase involved in polyketide biosynthesis